MRPVVTVDVVIFAMRSNDLAVLLVRRTKPPFERCWSLPGGRVNEHESLERAAARVLFEDAGLEDVALEQLGAFGDPGRDPRGHTVSVVYFTFAFAERGPRVGQADGDPDAGADAAWHLLRTLPIESDAPSPSRRRSGAAAPVVRLAFDHARIVAAARRRLQERLVDPTRPSPFELVPQHFTLTELQRVYEAVLGAHLDKRNFRARLLKSGMVEPLARGGAGDRFRHGRHRPAQLYRWMTPNQVG